MRQFAYELSNLRQDTIPFASKQRQTFNLAQGIPKDYFIHSFIISLTFRLAISGGTTNGTITAEAGQNLVERFEVSGNHKALGDYTRLLLQGSHVWQRGNIFKSFNHTRTGVPASGAIANNDITIVYNLPLVPARARPEEQIFYLLDAPMWNSLNLFVDWSDANSAVSGGDRTLALSAFGSATGTPTLTVTRVVAKLKGDRLKLSPIPVRETFKQIDISAGFADGLITPINPGNFIKELMLVTGVIATGASAPKAGDNFLTMSDNIYSRVKIKRDDVIQRDTPWFELQNFSGAQLELGIAWPSGYNLIDFNNCDPNSRTLATSYDTRQLALQNLRFELWGDVTATTNEKLHLISTELSGLPVFKKPATRAA